MTPTKKDEGTLEQGLSTLLQRYNEIRNKAIDEFLAEIEKLDACCHCNYEGKHMDDIKATAERLKRTGEN